MQHWNFSPYFWGLHGKYNLRGSLQENDIQKFVAVLISLKKSFPKQCINNFAGLKYFSSGITDTKGNKQLPRKVWLFKSACCTVHLVKPFSSLIWVISISTVLQIISVSPHFPHFLKVILRFEKLLWDLIQLHYSTVRNHQTGYCHYHYFQANPKKHIEIQVN